MFSWISLYKSILTGVSTWLALAVNLAVMLSFVDETHNQSSHNREDNRNAGRYRTQEYVIKSAPAFFVVDSFS